MNLKKVNLPVGNRIVIVAKFTGVKTQQINGGELLGLIAALRIALFVGIDFIDKIFCDSQVILYWSLRLGDEQRRKFDQLKVKYIDELIQLRKEFEKNGGIILKVSGNDNLADLGYHVNK